MKSSRGRKRRWFTLPPDTYFTLRLSPTTVKYVSHIFAWGQENVDLLRRYPELPANMPIHITGNPRGDMLRAEIRPYFDAEVQKLRDLYGDFILVNKKLCIDEYYPGVRNKFPLLLELADRWNISLLNIAHIGDDLSDLECLRQAGTAFCPADSVPEVLQQAHYVCKNPGGGGAVREACDLILKVNAAAVA